MDFTVNAGEGDGGLEQDAGEKWSDLRHRVRANRTPSLHAPPFPIRTTQMSPLFFFKRLGVGV